MKQLNIMQIQELIPHRHPFLLIDGIEDYEYFTMLKKLSEKRGKSDPLRIKAEALLDSLSRHPGTSAERETELRAEAAALLEAMNG